jgi:hypothetical protein
VLTEEDLGGGVPVDVVRLSCHHVTAAERAFRHEAGADEPSFRVAG